MRLSRSIEERERERKKEEGEICESSFVLFLSSLNDDNKKVNGCRDITCSTVRREILSVCVCVCVYGAYLKQIIRYVLIVEVYSYISQQSAKTNGRTQYFVVD